MNCKTYYKKYAGILFCVFFVILGGCSQINLLRTKELRQVQNEISRLEKEIQKMQASMGTGFTEQVANLKEQEETIKRMKADLQALIAGLEQQLAMMEGRIEESQHRLEMIDQKADKIDQKKFIIKTSFGKGGDSLSDDSTRPQLIVQEKTEVEKIYRLAYDDFQNRKYDLAISGFGDLIKNYPKDQLADNAQYWVGECYYAKKDYEKAVEEFRRVEANYPQGNKVTSAMYKIGLACEKAGKSDEKKKVWNLLIEKYPASDEAKLAKDRMESN